MAPIRVMLVDDQPLLRVGFRMVLDAEDDLTVIAEAGNGAEAVTLAARERPDVVLVHEYDVRSFSSSERDSLRAVAGLGNDREVVLGVEHHAEAHAEQRLVVDEHHPDRGHHSSSGSKAIVPVTRQPRLATGPASSV